MTDETKKGLDRRDFLKASTLACFAAVFGAFSGAGTQAAVAYTTSANEATAAARMGGPILTEAEIAKLPRVKQELAKPPFVPAHDQLATGGPKVIEVTMTIKELLWEVDDTGAETWAPTFDGSVPGPITSSER